MKHGRARAQSATIDARRRPFYPFSPETEHAERVQAALAAWGKQAFEALFDSRDGGALFANATAGGYEDLLLQVWSDDARILAWPWEALLQERGPLLRSIVQTLLSLPTAK